MTSKDLLIERAVRAIGASPSRLLGCPVLYRCDDCDDYHPALIVGWRCTDRVGVMLTVQDSEDALLDWRNEIRLDQILFIGAHP